MNRQEMQLILNKIAKEHNTTPEDVYREMQIAVDAAQANASPAAQAKWNSIPKSGDNPTVEEFIDFMVNTIKKHGY